MPTGLNRVGAPCTSADLAAAERGLNLRIPRSFTQFLQSWNGVSLFHDSLFVFGAGRGPDRLLSPISFLLEGKPRRGIQIAESWSGEPYCLFEDDGPVYHLRGGEEGDGTEVWLSGSSFPRWLDAIVAHEAVLFDSTGEYAEQAFASDGEEVAPRFAVKQAERAVRQDAGSAEFQHELALACRRLGRKDEADRAFGEALHLQPLNPWPVFDRGRLRLDDGDDLGASEDFETAAKLVEGATAARFWMFAARALANLENETARNDAAAMALKYEPLLRDGLSRAAEQSLADGDTEAHAEQCALLGAFTPVITRKRLPVI